MQSRASSSVRTLKIPNTLLGTTKTRTADIGMGSAAPTAAVPYRVRQPEFPATDNEVLKKSILSMAGFGIFCGGFTSYITIF